jgi:hypothetical protein
MKSLFLLLNLTLIIPTLSAQRLVKVTANTRICAAEGDVVVKDRYADNASPEAQKTITDICKKIGVSPNSFTIEAADVKNAEALIINEKRYIHYNPLYINRIKKESQTYWSMIFVLAHEIGHHVNGHLLKNDDSEQRRIEELASDKFAGCALSHLGASAEDLEKATSILSEDGDASHPPRDTRMTFALRGWEDCRNTPNVPNSSVVTESSSKKDRDCYKNNTGDLYFKNATRGQIKIHFSPQRGWYDQYNYITIDPEETKPFLNLKVGVNYFVIKALTKGAFGGDSFKDYKNEERRIETCADQSQSPIIIR